MCTDNKSYLIEFSQITLKYDFVCPLLYPTLVSAVGRECNIKAWGKKKRKTSLVFKPMQSLMGAYWKKLKIFSFSHCFNLMLLKKASGSIILLESIFFLGKVSDKFCFCNCKKCSLTQGQCKEEIILTRVHYSHHVPHQHRGVYHNYNEFLHSPCLSMPENWSHSCHTTSYIAPPKCDITKSSERLVKKNPHFFPFLQTILTMTRKITTLYYSSRSCGFLQKAEEHNM